MQSTEKLPIKTCSILASRDLSWKCRLVPLKNKNLSTPFSILAIKRSHSKAFPTSQGPKQTPPPRCQLSTTKSRKRSHVSRGYVQGAEQYKFWADTRISSCYLHRGETLVGPEVARGSLSNGWDMMERIGQVARADFC